MIKIEKQFSRIFILLYWIMEIKIICVLEYLLLSGIIDLRYRIHLKSFGEKVNREKLSV